MKKKFLLVCGCLFFLCLFAFSFVAEGADYRGYNIEIILDSSGSMAGRVEGRAKIDVAKEAVSSVINEIPESSFVGFRAYGHQSNDSLKNCKDSELVYPIGKINKGEFINKVNSLQPRGWTPIDYSLREAAKDFPDKSEYGKMILLVSDGEETCGGDPCGAVKELKAQGFDMTVNTVGFDVNDIAQQQLKCIADATGGEYKSAKNASELLESMRVFSRRAFEDYVTAGGVKAGSSFSTASLVSAGKYGGDILPEENKFYKINLNKGQKLVVNINVKRETALNLSYNEMCGHIAYALRVYDPYQSEINESKEINKLIGANFLDSSELSSKSLIIEHVAQRSGEYFFSANTSWLKGCTFDDNKKEREKKGGKVLYDIVVGTEGAGVEGTSVIQNNSGTSTSNNTNTNPSATADTLLSELTKQSNGSTLPNIDPNDPLVKQVESILSNPLINPSTILDPNAKSQTSPLGIIPSSPFGFVDKIIKGIKGFIRMLIYIVLIGVVVFIIFKVIKSKKNKVSVESSDNVQNNKDNSIKKDQASFNNGTSSINTNVDNLNKNKFCIHCGAKNLSGAKFCESCGGKLE